MNQYYADFHIHVGRSFGRPVKMAAAPSLTISNLLDLARREKGLDMVTIIDGVSNGPRAELASLVQDGRLQAVGGGGYVYENGLVVLLGAEVETSGPMGGSAHFGCWFDSIHASEDFYQWLATVQTNPSLSSQRARVSAYELQRAVAQREGLFIIHHAFTPHKGLYGNCVASLTDMLDPDLVDAVELGLSADSDMADTLSELADYTFLSNSDAHSLPKIAREYNVLALHETSFRAVRRALRRTADERVVGNYGLDPRLGKYHRTHCSQCGKSWGEGETHCVCGVGRKTIGVYDRLVEIRDRQEPVHPAHRPPYTHQIPLEFIPGLGPKMRQKLLAAFGSEMVVLHQTTTEDLAEVVGTVLAKRIELARFGKVDVQSGGGGTYGKAMFLPNSSD